MAVTYNVPLTEVYYGEKKTPPGSEEGTYTVKVERSQVKYLTAKMMSVKLKITFKNTEKWSLNTDVVFTFNGNKKTGSFATKTNTTERSIELEIGPISLDSDNISCELTLSRKDREPFLTLSNDKYLKVEGLYAYLEAPTLTRTSSDKYYYIGDPLTLYFPSVSNATSYTLDWTATGGGYETGSKVVYAGSNFISTANFKEKIYYFSVKGVHPITNGDRYIYIGLNSNIIEMSYETPPTVSPPTNLSGPSSITGGSYGTFTASGDSTVYIYVDGQSSSTGTLYYTPTSSGSKTVEAYCREYDSYASRYFYSTSIEKMVTVTDPSWNLTCVPASGYSIEISATASSTAAAFGSTVWFIAAGTSKDNAATAKRSTYSYSGTQTGTDWGIVKLTSTSSEITITKDNLLSWYSGDKTKFENEAFYYYIGCYATTTNSYTTQLRWNSACYTYGTFDATIKDLKYWNDVTSASDNTITGTQKNVFQDQFRLSWTNPTSVKLMGASITSISVQARSSLTSGWTTCEIDTTTKISTAPGAKNNIIANYKVAGTAYIRVFIVTTNGRSEGTEYENVLTSNQFQLKNFNVDTKQNLHPFDNTSTVLKFNWFDMYYGDMSSQDKVQLSMAIWSAADPTKVYNKFILESSSSAEYIPYSEAKTVEDMQQSDMLDYCIEEGGPKYYHNFVDAAATNDFFINTVKTDPNVILNGRYCYNFTLTVSNAFGKSKTIKSSTYNLQFGQPPSFAAGSEVGLKIYPYAAGAQTSHSLWDKAKTAEAQKRMVNPTETLVFNFPMATDPNNDLAYYRLYVYRMDDWKDDTTAPNNITNYDELRTFEIAESTDLTIEGDQVYLKYTLGKDYAYSKYCYFKITALDENEDESVGIFYNPTDKPYILRGRAASANLGISEVALGYYTKTTDKVKDIGKTYYIYDNSALRYFVYNGDEFDPEKLYEKTEGITARLTINTPITGQKPDLGGNLFQNSTSTYDLFPNLDVLEDADKDYTLTLCWSTDPDFIDDPTHEKYTESVDFKRPVTKAGEKGNERYYDDLITSHGDGIYVNGFPIIAEKDQRFNSKKIYVRFELKLRYAIDEVDSEGKATVYREDLVSQTPYVVIYSSTPTISPRPNYLGINNNTFNGDDVVVVGGATNRNKIRFKGVNHTIVFDIDAGIVTDLIIDCGTW